MEILTTSARVSPLKLVADFRKLKFLRRNRMKIRGNNFKPFLRNNIRRCRIGKIDLKQGVLTSRRALEVCLVDM